jgi:hypothetical protein
VFFGNAKEQGERDLLTAHLDNGRALLPVERDSVRWRNATDRCGADGGRQEGFNVYWGFRVTGTVATRIGAISACGDRCRRPHYRGAYFVNTKSFAFTRV